MKFIEIRFLLHRDDKTLFISTTSFIPSLPTTHCPLFIHNILLPLNRSRRLGTDVINYPVHTFYFIDNIIRYLCQEFIR